MAATMNRDLAPLKNGLRRARRFKDELLGRAPRMPVRHRCRRLRLGTEYGGWCICPDGLDTTSVVYAFGVGEDISFEREMIDRFDVAVHAFDPTPKSIEWLRSQALPAKFHFHPIGLADFDGVAEFELPRPDFTSYQMKHRAGDDPAPEWSGGASAPQAVEAPVERLATILKRIGHDAIHVLKMDIEGAEYDVLDDILESRIAIEQLLVEFHFDPSRPREVGRPRGALEALNRAGYRLFHRSPVGHECSFVRTA